MSMPTLSNEPVNNQWLDDYLVDLVNMTQTDEYVGEREDRIATAKQAITAKLESIEQEAYKRGYIAGGIEILNASCEVCHAYPMTADCNNANCHAIER